MTAARHLELVNPAPKRAPDGRWPAHDLDLEAEVLSAALTWREGRAVVRALISEADFFSAANGLILRAICAVDDEAQLSGTDTDVRLVAAWLRDRELIQTAGGTRYIGSIMDRTPARVQIEAICRKLRRLSQQRRLVAECQTIAAEGYDRVDEGWFAQSAARVQAAAEDLGAADFECGSDAFAKARREAADGFLAAQSGQPRPRGLRVGLWALDELTAGLMPGETTIVTAPTGGGKTLLAGQALMQLALDGHGVGIWSLEMPKEQLMHRMAIAHSGLSADDYRHGRLSQDEWIRYGQALDALQVLPIAWDDRKPPLGLRSMSSVMATLSHYKRQAPKRLGAELRVMVLDYVQLLDCTDFAPARSTRTDQLSRATYALKQLAEREGVALLWLAQLREGEIRDCKAVAHHAHNWWDLSIDAEQGTATVNVRKARSGRCGKATLWFDDRSVRFTDEQEAM